MYKINDKMFDSRMLQDFIEQILYDNLQDDFDESLNFENETIIIAGIEYDYGFVLYRVDPIAYEVYYKDYISNVCDNILDDIDLLDNGEIYELLGYEIIVL